MKTLNTYTFFENTIINSIDLESYDISNDLSLFDKIKKTYEIFKNEYSHEIIRQKGNEVKAFKEYLMGLPSCLTVPFMNYEILKNGTEYGFNLSSEALEDKFLEEYFYKCASAFFTLKNNL